MKNFAEKWKSDHIYQTKIKLVLYTLFVVIVAIYAITANKNTKTIETDIDELSNKVTTNENIFVIPKEYDYEINITTDNIKYTYVGTKTKTKEMIKKVVAEEETKYIYQNNQYYQEIDNDNYLVTSKEEIYDFLDSNYLNIENINAYLSKSQKLNNQYLVYLKDILLDNDTEDYFVILIDKNNINIDYTPLMKSINKDFSKCNVTIKIEEIE